VVAVRKIEKADIPAVAAALARSFHDDPVMTFVLPEKEQRDRMRRLFELDLTHMMVPLGESYTTEGEVMGAAMWAPPGKWKQPWTTLLRTAPLFLRVVGSRVRPAMRFMSLVERSHPKEPHYYLGTLGTDPHFQRSGVGSALLQPVLERCDAEGVPAYLESSKDVNVPYYRRHGFEVTRELTVPGGPTLWLMWRDPK